MTRKFYLRQDTIEIIKEEKALNGSAVMYIIPKGESVEELDPSINSRALIEIEINIVGKGRLK